MTLQEVSVTQQLDDQILSGNKYLEDIEQGLIASMITSDEACQIAIRMLKYEYFHISVHGRIFQSIKESVQTGKEIALPIIASLFESDPDLINVGGGEYIRSLVDGIISTKNTNTYACYIINEYKRRIIIDTTQNILSSVKNEDFNANKLLPTIQDVICNTTSKLIAINSAARPKLHPYTLDELQKLPSREFLIKGVFDRGGLSVMYGDSNCGKTFVAINQGLHIALGWRWRDFPVKQGKVVYIAAEGGLGINERIKAFLKHKNISINPPFYVIPESIDLRSNSSDTVGIIKEVNKLEGVELIIIDTLACAISGGNENSSDDMGQFIKNCKLIQGQTMAHVMIIHHSGKVSDNGARGHSSLRAAIDTEIQVKKSSNIITMEIKKQRDGRIGDKLNFTLDIIKLAQDEYGDDITSCVLSPTHNRSIKKQNISGQQKEALKILEDLISDKGESGILVKDMPEVEFVLLDGWKSALKDANIVASDSADNIRRVISRVIEDLNSKEVIVIWRDKVWIAGQGG